MPTNMHGSHRILCPFFRTQDKLSIGCEGPFEGALLTLRFLSVDDRQRQNQIFCENAYKRCELYRCIMQNRYPERYEED